MKATSNIASMLVLIHFVVLLAHGADHAHLNIATSSWQNAFITVVIFAAPLLALVLLWTRRCAAGFLVLGFSFAGFVDLRPVLPFFLSSPNVRHMRDTARGATSQLTAVLLALFEIAGSVVSMLSMRRVVRT